MTTHDLVGHLPKTINPHNTHTHTHFCGAHYGFHLFLYRNRTKQPTNGQLSWFEFSRSEVRTWTWIPTIITKFTGTFAELQNATISFVSVRPSAWNNSAPTGRIFMKFYIRVFRKYVQKLQVPLKYDRITGALHEDSYIYHNISLNCF
jgi:hypothetical protein